MVKTMGMDLIIVTAMVDRRLRIVDLRKRLGNYIILMQTMQPADR